MWPTQKPWISSLIFSIWQTFVLTVGMEQRHCSYSTLEVKSNDGQPLSDTQPGNDLPEVAPCDALEVVDNIDGVGPLGRGTLCGLRKKTFWIVLTAAVSIIAVSIAVGVGVSVGVGLARNNSSSSAGVGRDGRIGRVAPFSRLAAADYTDRQNIDHTQVYYQDDSLNLWMADLDFWRNEWTGSQVNTTELFPRNGTPIAAFNLQGDSQVDFHIRFVSSQTDQIRAFFSDNLHKDVWKRWPTVDGSWTVTNDSNLATLSADCINCETTEFLVFHSDVTNRTAFAYPSEPAPNFNNSMPNGIVPDTDTAYALVPIEALANLHYTQPSAGLYLSVGKTLREFYFATGKGWSTTDFDLTMKIDSGAHIAAMAFTQDDLHYVQVLVTRETGGVQMAYLGPDELNDQRWAWVDSIDGMEDVVPLSPISATQIGRVYALEEGEDGCQIVEFKRNSTKEAPTFERLGPLKLTTIINT